MSAMKKPKGKKKGMQQHAALERIMGYAGSDVEADVESSTDEGEEEEDEENKDDGLLDRDYIKLRALKMSARMANQMAKA